MTEKQRFDPARTDMMIAILIALTSLTIALAVWRTNVVGSSAADANRQGLVDALKKSAAQNEDWRKVYEEAGYASRFAVETAAAEAMDASKDKTLVAASKNLRQYLLPSLQLRSEPLGTQEKYLKPDGNFDIEKRFADLGADAPDVLALDPVVSFALADQYSSEQRWLSVGIVLLAISLFWLGLAKTQSERGRAINLTLGVGVYLLGLLFVLIVEAVFIIGRGGVL
jgi:hypothetical protein